MGLLMASGEYEYPIGVITVHPKWRNRIKEFTEKPVELAGERLANCAVALLSRAYVACMKEDDRDIFGGTLGEVLVGASGRPKGVFLISQPTVSWFHLQRAADWIDVQKAYFDDPEPDEDWRVAVMREKLRKMGIVRGDAP